MDLGSIFESREKKFQEIYGKYESRHSLISVMRVIIFVLALILIVLFANVRNGEGIALTLVGFTTFFVLLVKYHQRLAQKRDMAKSISTINAQEIHRLKGELDGLPSGVAFADKLHPYLGDLDILGPNSLYQLIQRCVTPSGEKCLARWLSYPASVDVIIQRQEAVKELVPQLEWRQEFQASGMQKNETEIDAGPLVEWINEPNQIIHNLIIKLAAVVLPLITLAMVFGNIFFDLSIYFTITILVINGIALKRFTDYVTNLTKKTSKSIHILKAYGSMIACIEAQNFESDLLANLKSAFVHEGSIASRSILKLQKILDYLQARSNAFYLIFNLFLLFDIHLVLWAERWKKGQRADVNQWFDKIGEFEAINSLAGFANANPDYAMPDISDQPYIMKARAMGHPLIHTSERVYNDFDMCGKGVINIITGSNMSGKSTFLRTVGVNTIIALAGGPVCARGMTVSQFQVFTGMRTEDNLEEHVSSFYAELKRIKLLLDILEKKEMPILFMLDEILKGTNSRDRHKGAAALVRQVSDKEAMGFVSTHDLELGQLADEDLNVKNYSFNSKVEGDEIIFNYKLEKGICHSFNASKLMEKIGINMNLAENTGRSVM